MLTPRLAVLFFVPATLAACGEDGAATIPAPPSHPDAGAEGCAPGETPLERGACRAAGIASDGCAAGFEHDGRGGCEPILPAEPCGPGTMALPGETACHEVAPCGAGDWGDVPADATTQFVRAGFVGSSDGTMALPWPTLAEGIAAATPGAIVALAKGSYPEHDVYLDQPVRIWGACPAEVEIVPGAGTTFALIVTADGVELHDLAIRGAGSIGITSAADVVLERLWIHDVAAYGVQADDQLGPTGVVIRGSLIEHATKVGLSFAGADAEVQGSVIRDTIAPASAGFAAGISISRGFDTARHSSATVRGSLVERNLLLGVLVSASEAVIEGTVVRDTTAAPALPLSGAALSAQTKLGEDDRASVDVRQCLFERNVLTGISVLGSDVRIDSTVVRDTQSTADDTGGAGISAGDQDDPPVTSNLEVRWSLIERNRDAGITAVGASTTVEGTLIRDTTAEAATGMWGTGITSAGRKDGLALVTVRGSVFERDTSFGIFAQATDLTVESTLITGTQPEVLRGFFGRGMQITVDPDGQRSKAIVRGTRIEKSYEGGVVVVGSEVSLEDDEIVEISSSYADGELGDGVLSASHVADASVTIEGTRIEKAARAGVSAFGCNVQLRSIQLECNSIHLDGEVLEQQSFSFEDLGSNVCGCAGAPVPCKVLSSSLTPPSFEP